MSYEELSVESVIDDMFDNNVTDFYKSIEDFDWNDLISAESNINVLMTIEKMALKMNTMSEESLNDLNTSMEAGFRNALKLVFEGFMMMFKDWDDFRVKNKSIEKDVINSNIKKKVKYYGSDTIKILDSFEKCSNNFNIAIKKIIEMARKEYDETPSNEKGYHIPIPKESIKAIVKVIEDGFKAIPNDIFKGKPNYEIDELTYKEFINKTNFDINKLNKSILKNISKINKDMSDLLNKDLWYSQDTVGKRRRMIVWTLIGILLGGVYGIIIVDIVAMTHKDWLAGNFETHGSINPILKLYHKAMNTTFDVVNVNAKALKKFF